MSSTKPPNTFWIKFEQYSAHFIRRLYENDETNKTRGVRVVRSSNEFNHEATPLFQYLPLSDDLLDVYEQKWKRHLEDDQCNLYVEDLNLFYECILILYGKLPRVLYDSICRRIASIYSFCDLNKSLWLFVPTLFYRFSARLIRDLIHGYSLGVKYIFNAKRGVQWTTRKIFLGEFDLCNADPLVQYLPLPDDVLDVYQEQWKRYLEDEKYDLYAADFSLFYEGIQICYGISRKYLQEQLKTRTVAVFCFLSMNEMLFHAFMSMLWVSSTALCCI
jgi:hypothetical protein